MEKYSAYMIFHPGVFLKDDLKEMGTTIAEFAEKSGIEIKTLASIILEKQDITEELANQLATAISDTSPRYWLYLQKVYDFGTHHFKTNSSDSKFCVC